MKHMFGLLLLICMISVFNATEFRAAAGLDLMGESLGSGKALFSGIKNQMGVSISGQVINTTDNIRYGFGMDVQLPRELKSIPGWNSNLISTAFVPLYGMLSYSFPEYRGYSPEFFSQLGYSVPIFKYRDETDDDLYQYKYKVDGGLFTGFGVGMRHKNTDVQLLYRVNRSSIESKKYHEGELVGTSHSNCDTRQWNLSIGYRFKDPIK